MAIINTYFKILSFVLFTLLAATCAKPAVVVETPSTLFTETWSAYVAITYPEVFVASDPKVSIEYTAIDLIVTTNTISTIRQSVDYTADSIDYTATSLTKTGTLTHLSVNDGTSSVDYLVLSFVETTYSVTLHEGNGTSTHSASESISGFVGATDNSGAFWYLYGQHEIYAWWNFGKENLIGIGVDV